jgi:hypothetical protein
MARDYEKNPTIIRATVEVYIYDEQENLEQRVEHFNRRQDVQEAAMNLVGGYFSDSCGLNKCEAEIIE